MRRLLSAFTAYAPSELNVFGHNGYTLGMNGAEVGVLKEADEVSLARLLESHYSRTLEPEVGLEVLSDLTNQPLERQLPDEQFSTLLVTPDFSKSDCSRPVPVWLFHTSGSWGALPRGLGCELLPGRFASSRLPSRLLSTSHVSS